MKKGLAEKLIMLRLRTRLVTMCEDDSKKNTLNLKTKILFLLSDKPLPPVDIITALNINKTNLALLSARLCAEGLAKKDRHGSDRREIILSITDKGMDYLNKRIDYIERLCNNAFEDAEYENALKILDEALSIIEFMI